MGSSPSPHQLAMFLYDFIAVLCIFRLNLDDLSRIKLISYDDTLSYFLELSFDIIMLLPLVVALFHVRV
jgi:hypothetical protein